MSFDPIEADLILLHPPSVYDFRERRDVLFAYLSNSDSVACSSIYEIYPLGFKSLKTYLEKRGFSVRIINLASLMLRKFDLDVPAFLQSLNARIVGLDLHWVCHAHGGLEIAKLLQQIHPDVPRIFGGISSTLYADELIQYDQVDMVMMGYDTHEPMHQLLTALRDGTSLESVSNLAWKSGSQVHQNDFDHVPRTFAQDCDADWRPFMEKRKEQSPALMVLPSSGCSYNCGWCGGSRDSVRRIMKTKHTVAAKTVETITAEMDSMCGSPAAPRSNIYTLNAYNFKPAAMDAYLSGVSKAGIGHVSYEQFHLTKPDVMRKMVASARTTLNVSPESHEREISRLAGRGVFSMDEMEEWIEEALEIGVWSINVWFFIGMPKQTAESVYDTVEYSRHLMQRFRGKRVVPLLCPMLPFLDPGCTFFTEPEDHGYRVFHKSLEDHRRALVHPSFVRRLNYETDWLSREQLVEVSYDAVSRLTEAKRECGFLPRSVVEDVRRRIDEAREFVFRVDEVCESDGVDAAVERFGDEILAYNTHQFRAGISDQLIPIPRSLDNRWFDEFEID